MGLVGPGLELDHLVKSYRNVMIRRAVCTFKPASHGKVVFSLLLLL